MRLGLPPFVCPSQPIKAEGFERPRFFWILLGIPPFGAENGLVQQFGPVSTGDSGSARHRESPRPVAAAPPSFSSVFCGPGM